jgi:hypothetical protein
MMERELRFKSREACKVLVSHQLLVIEILIGFDPIG